MRSELFQTTSKIAALAKSGLIVCARELFDTMAHRDLVAWNAMLSSYSQLGLHQEALSLFHRMRVTNTRPDHFSFTSILSSCAGSSELHFGTKIHAFVVVMGYQSSLPVSNSLIDMYGKCLNPSNARKVFEEMSIRNEVSWCSLLFAHINSSHCDIAHEVFDMIPKRVEIAWNIMISGHARYGEVESCLDLFIKMQENSCKPDQWTFSSIMNACTESSCFMYGCVVHCLIIKNGWSSAVEAKNSILSFYSGLGCYDNAIKVFDSIRIPTQVSWNAIIDTHMKVGHPDKALQAFKQVLEKNTVSWTSMITGYARNGNGQEAVSLFVEMMRNGHQPDDLTFGAVLHGCSSLAILGHGKMVHCCIIQRGFQNYVYIGNGLVTMYAKCGDLEGSNRAFNDIVNKDLISWNAMLFGFGLHGKAVQALQVFEEMLHFGVRPDKVTFIGLLMTCSHSGFIEQSHVFFKSMKKIYGISHEVDHAVCMIDMLGRRGYLEEAKELATEYSRMYSTNIESFREVLLGACSAYGDVKLVTYLGESLKIFEPEKETSYVLMSNLYCARGQWEAAENIRKVMDGQGIKKMPGCSWIEVRNKVRAFVAGNHSDLNMKELYRILYVLEFDMRNPSFVGFVNW